VPFFEMVVKQSDDWFSESKIWETETIYKGGEVFQLMISAGTSVQAQVWLKR
jgi:hypothetical protein